MMKTNAKVVMFSLLCALLAPAAAAQDAAPVTALGGVDLAAMDQTVSPGVDFYAYANGTWLRNTQIAADRASNGVGVRLVELTNQRTADLIRQLGTSGASTDADAHKVADYFAAYMDTAAIEAKGIAPLRADFDRIAAIRDKRGLAEAFGRNLRNDVDVFNATKLHTPHLFGLWVAQDLDDPAKYSPFLLQGGLSMPDREYYLDPSPRMVDIRTKFVAHVAALLKLANIADAGRKATSIVALEKRIAEVHSKRVDTEDVEKGNNHWQTQDFATKAPGLDWSAYFAAAGLSKQREFVVWQPSAISGISRIVADVPLRTWKDYLVYHALEGSAQNLPAAFVDENFAFFGRTLTGTPKLRERWKLGVSATSIALGDAVGKLYVARYFPPERKARLEAMVRELIVAFGARIDRLDWMAPATKAKAKAKLATLKVGVGYPDKWIDYGALKIDRDDAFGNTERAQLFEYARNLRKLGQPIDRSEWVMTPQTVNAVNLPVMNALNFPAAYLQPPSFDPSKTVAMNYGAIGATIGHEISHSFDDQGALFDATGKLQNWWTKADFAHFQASAAALVRQYDGYHPFPDVVINGKQVLAENIADLAGLAVAYDAYKSSLHGKEAPVVQGMTGDQQFFISFAQSWQSKMREQAARQRLLTDGHALDEYRADTVRNLDAWYAAFNVVPGQALYLAPAERVRVW